MFIYLSKKIAIPACTKINCMAWNKQDGYIAIGGINGMLKVLLLDTGNETETFKARLTTSSNLSMNETLEGHTGNILELTWNETHKRLTTSDENGVIIVWMLYKGTWYEEMINNRKKSTVTGMAWSSDGTRICIVYDDGGVIVGSVDGNRIWGKELKGYHLTGVQWSPDNKLLLFALSNGQLHLYDNQGNFFMRIGTPCNDSVETSTISGIDWYNGVQVLKSSPCLAICFENGRAQIMQNASDSDPVVIDTKMLIVHCCWNHNGTLLAITGRMIEGEKTNNVVRFYNCFGEHLRTLKVPGQAISCSSWEGGSLRIALAVESFIYFANVRPDYKWCYFNKTIVYTSHHPQKSGTRVTFWNINNNQCHTKFVPILLDIASSKEYCVLAATTEENPAEVNLMICDTFGTALDGQQIVMDVQFVTMNEKYVVAASKYYFIIWNYSTPKSAFSATRHYKVRAFHIDDLNPLKIMQDKDSRIEFEHNKERLQDRITCVTCCKQFLVIGRESGILYQYSLPNCELVNRRMLSSRPHKIQLNCNSTRLSVIDIAGIFHVYNITSPGNQQIEEKIERKDVWSMCWASDNPQSFVIMEKTRMYVFKGLFPEEPISCSGYICDFINLEIQAVLLDELLENPEKPDKKYLFRLEVKSLRDTRQLLENVNINEARKFVEDNPHPRLWRLLAEAALKKNDLATAELAFIRSQNYPGILFINKLRKVPETILHPAFVALFLKQFDEAEKIFLDVDRSDLALKFCQTIGNWFRVVQLLKTSDNKNDHVLNTAYNAIGDYFAHNQNWQAALEYYDLAKNMERIVECYCQLDDYNSLEKTMNILPEKDPLLKRIAKKFAAEAIFPQVVHVYEKMGQIDTAKRFCILHNRWNLAFDLALKYSLPDIAGLFDKYSNELIDQNRITKAIEVNVQAEYYLQAAGHTIKLAETEMESPTVDCERLQKMYVFAALLFREYFNRKSPSKEWVDLNMIENAWKGARAFYFIRRLYFFCGNGNYYNAMRLAIKLQDYVGIFSAYDVYNLLAATSFKAKHYNITSKAFMKLEKLPNLSKTEKIRITQSAVFVFKQKSPFDTNTKKILCIGCKSSISDWSSECLNCERTFNTCIVSGASIISTDRFWQCSTCYSCALEEQITAHNVCPLCHTACYN